MTRKSIYDVGLVVRLLAPSKLILS